MSKIVTIGGDYKIQHDAASGSYFIVDYLRADPKDPTSPSVTVVTTEQAESMRKLNPRCRDNTERALAYYLADIFERKVDRRNPPRKA